MFKRFREEFGIVVQSLVSSVFCCIWIEHNFVRIALKESQQFRSWMRHYIICLRQDLVVSIRNIVKWWFVLCSLFFSTISVSHVWKGFVGYLVHTPTGPLLSFYHSLAQDHLYLLVKSLLSSSCNQFHFLEILLHVEQNFDFLKTFSTQKSHKE